MIQITPQMRTLLAVEPVDLRKGIDGLAALCRQKLRTEPFEGALFVVSSRRRKTVKILACDGQGFWVCQNMHSPQCAVIRISGSQKPSGRYACSCVANYWRSSSFGNHSIQEAAMSDKITSQHLERTACVYIRQSTLQQAQNNLESSRRQYALEDRARALGFKSVVVIDDDLGISGRGSRERPGLARLLGALCKGEVGAVFALEASRLFSDLDFAQLPVFTTNSEKSGVCRSVRSRADEVPIPHPM